jgi:hypothetical protein
VRILTNFMNSPEFIEFAQDVRIKVIRSDAWPEVQKLLESADVIVIDCRDLLLYRICVHFPLFPIDPSGGWMSAKVAHDGFAAKGRCV